MGALLLLIAVEEKCFYLASYVLCTDFCLLLQSYKESTAINQQLHNLEQKLEQIPHPSPIQPLPSDPASPPRSHIGPHLADIFKQLDDEVCD